MNDLESFFRAYPSIGHVFFNGKKAARSFELGVRLPSDVRARLTFTVLPSTSPANAAMRYDDKLAAWWVVRDALGGAEGQVHSIESGEGFEHSSAGGTRRAR